MKNLSKTFSIITALSALALGGCGSTSKVNSEPELATNHRVIKVTSTDKYEWKENRSMALNIAEMARPSGAGFGLRDSNDPTNGVQSSAKSSDLLTFATGFYTGNILSGFGLLSLDAKRDKLLDYNPYIIDFVDKDEIDLNDEVATFNVLKDRLGEKLSSAIEKSGIDAKYVGAYGYSIMKAEVNTAVYIDGGACREGMDFLAPEDIKGAKPEGGLKKHLIGLPDEAKASTTGCGIYYITSIAGKIGDKYIVVHEMYATNLAMYFTQKVAPHSDMAFFFPEDFEHINEATRKKFFIKFPFAFVSYKGEQLLFDAKKDSTPILN